MFCWNTTLHLSTQKMNHTIVCVTKLHKCYGKFTQFNCLVKKKRADIEWQQLAWVNHVGHTYIKLLMFCDCCYLQNYNWPFFFVPEGVCKNVSHTLQINRRVQIQFFPSLYRFLIFVDQSTAPTSPIPVRFIKSAVTSHPVWMLCYGR